MNIKARTVTQFVDALEKDHYIMRVPDPTDRRATILQLTEKTKSLMDKVEEAMVQISAKWIEHLSVESQQQLRDILLHLGSTEAQVNLKVDLSIGPDGSNS